MFSYWEQQIFLFYHHIVIGSGIVGLSTAISIKQKFPHQRVLVLERGLLPTGASTRNAGFACMGSVTELLGDLETMREDEVVQLFEQRKKGLALLRSRLGDGAIGYKSNGSYELISTKDINALDKIEYLNSLLLTVNKQPSFSLVNEKIKEFGFDRNYTKALICNTCEGEIHTGKMMRSLVDYALAQGVEIKTGAWAKSYNESADGVSVMVEDQVHGDIIFSCDKLFLCTNAFTHELMPNAKLVAGRGQVLITKPIEGLKFKGVFHFDEGYYYFREIDGRVLIGGGRNIDFDAEATITLATTDLIQQNLEQKLQDIILPNTLYEVDMRWSGIMAFGDDKNPIIKAFTDRVYGAFRMGGMGIAIGSLAGERLAHMVD